jgi:vitamin B12 transporter
MTYFVASNARFRCAFAFRFALSALSLSIAVAGAPAWGEPPQLSTTVVTAARQPVSLDDTLQDVTVIDRATIDARTGSSLEELLSEQAGIQIETNGGTGSNSSVFIRGANAGHTLLLIDGVRYGSATTGDPVFYNIPLSQVDHIEIVRGPLSSLYGSDAAGGVIQIFTRQGEPGFSGHGSVTVGNEAYKAIDGGVRGASGNLDYAVDLGAQKTDGYPFTNPNVAFGDYNTNNDGMHQTSASLNLGYRFAPGWTVRAQGLDSRGAVQFADGVDPTQSDLTARSKIETSTGTLSVQGQVLPGWGTTLRYGASRDDYNTDVAVDSFDLGSFTTTQHVATWQNDVATPIGTLLAGVEQLHQSVASNVTDYDIASRTVDSVMLGLRGRAGPNGWQVNVRRDDNSEFGHPTTGSLAYGFDLTPQWRIGASAGTSFVMPSFNDLYFPGFSNPDLKPERGRSFELNLRWKTDIQQARLSLYENRFRDLIALDTNFLPVNVAQARIRGASLEYDIRLDAVTIGAALDEMDPIDLGTGLQLTHRARDTASLNVDWQVLSAWSVGTTWRGAGRRYDDEANTQALGGYGVLALRAAWRFRPDWQLQLRVDNATDHKIQPAFGYDAPPTQVFLTLRYAPG